MCLFSLPASLALNTYIFEYMYICICIQPVRACVLLLLFFHLCVRYVSIHTLCV